MIQVLKTGPVGDKSTGGSQPHTNMSPFSVINFIINVDETDPMEGEIRMWSGTTPPSVLWEFCQGQDVLIVTYPNLFTLIGVTYGGDGQDTFALPDFRGRGSMGEGSGPGLSPRALGDKAGIEDVTLTVSEIPLHNHV